MTDPRRAPYSGKAPSLTRLPSSAITSDNCSRNCGGTVARTSVISDSSAGGCQSSMHDHADGFADAPRPSLS